MRATLLLLAVALLAGCGIGSGRDEALGQALEVAIGSAPDSGVVDLSKLVPGPWDEVVVFDRGTPASRMRADLGLDWPAADDAASALENEDVEALVFLSGGKVTTWAAMWITHGEIPFGRWQASPADGRPVARFTVTRSPLHGMVLVPVAASLAPSG
jgi:hypothetical protein